MSPVPKILYKYRSLSGDSFRFSHDIFMNNELYFPHPDQINDPFDCKIPPSFDNLTKKDIEKFVKRVDRRIIEAKVGNYDDWKRNFLATPISTIKERLKSSSFKSHQEIGVLSLSGNEANLLMWGHYADSHKGICIGFDSSELSFAFKEMPLLPERVNYPEDNEYPKWYPLDIYNSGQRISMSEEMIDQIYFTKSLDWKYEKEWRIIFPENGSTSQKINSNAIVSVHLGCEIEESAKETIINWCLLRERKPKVYQMKKDKISYSLKPNEIRY